MKSISGKITSTKEISLSKASNVLSNFVHTNNGASQAVSAYLRRTLAAFDELVQLHKDLKVSKPKRKRKKPEQECLSVVDGETVKQEENEGSEGKRRKKKKRKSEEISSKEEEKQRRGLDTDFGLPLAVSLVD